MKLEMNRAWSQATSLIGANKDVVLIVAGVFFFVPYLALMIAMPDAAAMGADPTNTEAMFEQLGAAYADLWWALLLVTLLQAVGMLGLMALLTDHRRPTLGEALKIGARKTLSYIGAYLLFAVVAGLLTVAVVAAGAAAGETVVALLVLVLVVLFVYAIVKFSLVPAVLVKEDVANPITALSRSWKMTKGNSLRLFFFYFLLFVVMFVLMMVLSIVVALVFGLMGSEAMTFGSALLTSAINAGWITVFLAVVAAVHDQLGGTGRAQISETFE